MSESTKGKEDTLLNDREAAELLRVKPCTVRNERIRGKLAFVQIGARIFYTADQIAQYLERQKVSACESVRPSPSPDKSEPTGSARSRYAPPMTMSGAALGTTAGLDRHAVSALAQQIFKRPASNLRPGSSKTTAPAEKPGKTRS